MAKMQEENNLDFYRKRERDVFKLAGMFPTRRLHIKKNSNECKSKTINYRTTRLPDVVEDFSACYVKISVILPFASIVRTTKNSDFIHHTMASKSIKLK